MFECIECIRYLANLELFFWAYNNTMGTTSQFTFRCLFRVGLSWCNKWNGTVINNTDAHNGRTMLQMDLFHWLKKLTTENQILIYISFFTVTDGQNLHVYLKK